MKVKVIRSMRESIAIKVNTDLSVTVKVPYAMTQYDIDCMLEENKQWIRKQQEEIKRRKAEGEYERNPMLTNKEISELTDKAKKYIPERVAAFAGAVGVDYNKISIRKQKTLWGSCSSEGNLSFNCLLMLAPPEVIDYVVVHELCHRKEMNHSAAFWKEVARVLPDYKKSYQWLKAGGRELKRRVEW